ncbi:MAG TPA: hypothetical protein VK348_14130 [Planctomycetota bacterium]|nr:hypothetical protein [Planctomycetota bacterium]
MALARILTTSALVALCSGSITAQVRPGIFGHLVMGVNGTAGEFCFVFDCTPRPFTAHAGETLTLQVNAPFQTLFAIGASFGANSCVSFPQVGNMLVLDQPVVVLMAGMVSHQSPILACWGGFEQVSLPLPAGLPSGLSFATQAAAEVPTLNGTAPVFSVAVQTTIL